MTPLSKSPFSYHFRALLFLGAWLYETDDQRKVNWYVTYKILVNFVSFVGVYALLLDLYLVREDMKKLTWNLCVTLLLVGTLIKNFQTLQKNRILNKLRLDLHTAAESRQSPEDISIHESALKELKLLRTSFYGTAAIFIPTWMITRYWGYLYGTRELPIPLRLPAVIDLDDEVTFNVVFLVVGFAAILGMILAMETELAMYGILIQILREYKILVKDIRVLNEIYKDEELRNVTISVRQNEVNPQLRKTKVERLVKKFSSRQKELIEYTKAFENCYSQPLLQEFFGISVLIIALALQCLWESVEFSGNLLYQIGYLFINVADMFLICLFSTRLKTQCYKVGETVYATFWYKMEVDTQKGIGMIILRSQHPPKITIGNFMELGLNSFMSIMSHIYSWLALFRQLDTSSQGSITSS